MTVEKSLKFVKKLRLSSAGQVPGTTWRFRNDTISPATAIWLWLFVDFSPGIMFDAVRRSLLTRRYRRPRRTLRTAPPCSPLLRDRLTSYSWPKSSRKCTAAREERMEHPRHPVIRSTAYRNPGAYCRIAHFVNYQSDHLILSDRDIINEQKWLFTLILCVKMVFRPKYLLIPKLTENITLCGRRWKPHGSSSKETSGKETSSKEGSTQEEEIMP